MAAGGSEIDGFRKEIDETDREIVSLIMRRAELARKIGESKRREATPLYRPDREKDVYARVVRYAKEAFGNAMPLPESVLKNIYREIMSGSIAIEGGVGVAYMGPPASFSHIAVRQRFGSSVREVAVDSIPDVFRAVESGHDVVYGLVPVENSIEGPVTLTLDSFLGSDLKIYAEAYVRVGLNLVYPGIVDLDEIKTLYTIKIVKEQCRDWLQQNLDMHKVRVVETTSTTAAAQLALQNRDGAAIVSDLAAETYGLDILSAHIEDSPNNITRFLVIGREQCPPTGDDKTSIVCAVRDRPGSLFDLLKPFHETGINLTRIESRSTRKSYGDYNFFIDFLGHHQDARIKEILDLLAERTTFLRLLGSYPRAELP